MGEPGFAHGHQGLVPNGRAMPRAGHRECLGEVLSGAQGVGLCCVSDLQHPDTAVPVPSPRDASSDHWQALHTEMVRNLKQKRRKPAESAHLLFSSLSPGSCSAPACAAVAPWCRAGSPGAAPGVPVPAPGVPVPAPSVPVPAPSVLVPAQGCGCSAGTPAHTLGAALPRHGAGTGKGKEKGTCRAAGPSHRGAVIEHRAVPGGWGGAAARCHPALSTPLSALPPSVRLSGGWRQRLPGRLCSARLDCSSNSCHP